MLRSLKGNIHAIVLVTSFLVFTFFPIRDIVSTWKREAVTTQQASIGEQANLILPVRIQIPQIGVDAELERVGLKQDGSLAAPKNPAHAAWFEDGPLPGEMGSSVIDGHFGWWNHAPAVFDSLGKVQKGDKIYVVYADSRTVSFVVRDIRIFVKGQDASSVFISSDEKIHLNLISCVGEWNTGDQSYSHRLVVFADIVLL